MSALPNAGFPGDLNSKPDPFIRPKGGPPMFLTPLVQTLYRMKVARGDGGLDSISVFKLFDKDPAV